MNAHDSERISGLLEDAGYLPGETGESDVVIFNTCAVRENADNKLYGNLGTLLAKKEEDPNFQIAVGGCLAQKDRDLIIKKAPWVDVVFGTHNMGSLPVLLERARHNREAQVEIIEALETFPSDLPTKRDSTYSGMVSISVGCNNSCTFCIVPALRGKEKDRRPGEILSEIKAMVDDGVIEIMLLGQNVNTYGVEFGDRGAFAKLLRACGEIEGLERVRFISPHPAAFTDDVIEAMAETHNVMPHLHMPLQSGSNSILKAMKRSYRTDKYLGILDRVRAAMPQASITTDIIVGFPGETEDDFVRTLEVAAEADFDSTFTFIFSPREGTEAANMVDHFVDPAVVAERFERLRAVVERSAWLKHQAREGRIEEIVVEGPSRRNPTITTGRTRQNKLVHFTAPHALRPGTYATAEITRGAPHFLEGRFVEVLAEPTHKIRIPVASVNV